MVMDVREERPLKQKAAKLVTRYVTPSLVTLSGMMTSIAEPLNLASSAVCVSVFNLYMRSSSWYSIISALTLIPKAAKIQRNRIRKVNKCFMVNHFSASSSYWTVNGLWNGHTYIKGCGADLVTCQTRRKIRLLYRYGLTRPSAPAGFQLINYGAELVYISVISKYFCKKT